MQVESVQFLLVFQEGTRMDTERMAQFQALVALDPSDTVVRFGLGELYVQAQAFAQAAEQFAEIIRLDPHYSAAYRYLGQAYAALGRYAEAAETFQRGIAIAEARGDLQTVKEMRVFLRRLHKSGEAEA
jgi:tetratricopeptide (TPR) repeat protein